MSNEPLHIEASWDLPSTIPHNPYYDPDAVRKEVISIRQRYTSGERMYPRSTVIDVSRQLKARCKVITIKGWDGEVQEFPYQQEHSKHLIPTLTYKSLEEMLADLYCDGDVVGAKPLRINWGDPPLTSQSLTDEQAMATLQTYKDLWCQGEAHRLLISSMASLIPTKVIGIAAGSMLGETKEAPLFQHAAVYAIAQAFGIKAYCQDPEYTIADKALLNRLGISVLENPDAFLEVDQSSIVLSIAPAVAVKQIIADDREYWPMAMIWNRMESVDEETALFQPPPKLPLFDPTGDRVRAMVEHYSRVPFPVDPRFSYDQPVDLCVRKSL